MSLEEVLKKLNIKYQEVSHHAVYTVEEAQFIKKMIKGVGCKNLFLRNKNNYFLVVLQDDKILDIKGLSKILNVNKLSFANDMEAIINLKAGNCSPFGIINDKENKVKLVIDKDLTNNYLLFHPNRNTATISIYYDDLIKFIKYLDHDYILF